MTHDGTPLQRTAAAGLLMLAYLQSQHQGGSRLDSYLLGKQINLSEHYLYQHSPLLFKLLDFFLYDCSFTASVDLQYHSWSSCCKPLPLTANPYPYPYGPPVANPYLLQPTLTLMVLLLQTLTSYSQPLPLWSSCCKSLPFTANPYPYGPPVANPYLLQPTLTLMVLLLQTLTSYSQPLPFMVFLLLTLSCQPFIYLSWPSCSKLSILQPTLTLCGLPVAYLTGILPPFTTHGFLVTNPYILQPTLTIYGFPVAYLFQPTLKISLMPLLCVSQPF